MTWWTLKAPGTPCAVVFFQLDISGHSSWAAGLVETETIFGAAINRAEFCDMICAKLRYLGFDRVFWAGDGGLFAKEYLEQSDANKVTQAAKATFDWFTQWKRLARENSSLRLRVTATYISNVIIDSETGNWFSTELNNFLKYERSIAHPNAFIITNALHTVMNPREESYQYFKRRQSEIDLPDGTRITTWIDDRNLAQSAEGLRPWLVNEIRTRRIHGNVKEGDITLGDADLIDVADGVEGYNPNVILTEVAAHPVEEYVAADHQKLWLSLANNLVKLGLSGTKCWLKEYSIKYPFGPEVAIDPCIKGEWCQISYPQLRAFHQLVSSNKDAHSQYLGRWHSLRGGRRIELPNTLCQYVIVTFRDAQGSNILLLHRRRKTDPGYILPNCWSATSEEQINPLKTTYNGNEHEGDLNTVQVIEKMIRREIIGESEKFGIDVRLHGVVMERPILTYGILAVAELRNISYSDIKETQLWRGINDNPEYDAVAILPLQPEIVRGCLSTDSLPKNIWDSIDRSARGSLPAEDHAWHPVSKLRLAYALWWDGAFGSGSSISLLDRPSRIPARRANTGRGNRSR